MQVGRGAAPPLSRLSATPSRRFPMAPPEEGAARNALFQEERTYKSEKSLGRQFVAISKKNLKLKVRGRR